MRELVSVNGELMAAEQARVSVFDSGFMQGVGLFETMRAYHGEVFRLRAHTLRLTASAQALGWSAPPDPDALAAEVTRVVGALEHSDARVRLTVTTGTLRTAGPETPALTVVVSAAPGVKYPPEHYRKGVSAIVSPYRYNRADPTAGHKTTSYFSRLAGLRQAHARGAMEALWYCHEGRLAEGSISSVFAVKDGRLLTAPLDTPVLPGVTRAAVIQLARDLRLEVLEQGLTVDETHDADELFLTNSLMELMPVVRLGREPIGTEKPGEITRMLAEAYGKQVEEECAA